MFDIHATSAPAFVICVEGGDFILTDINAACVAGSDLELELELGRSLRERFDGAMADKLAAHYRRCIESRLPVSYDVQAVLPAGYTHWRTTLIPFQSRSDGAVASLVGFCTDITADTLAERARNAFHEKLSLAMGVLDGGFWTYDTTTREFEASRPLTELLAGPGHPPLNLAEYANYIHEEDLPSKFSFEDEIASVDYRVVTFEGRLRWLRSKRRYLRNAAGSVTQVLGLVIDVTDERARQQRLETEATTDALTGLRNRRSFDRVAERWLFTPFCETRTFALLLIDLDGFKPINDTHGHRVGDQVLRGVARRLGRVVRPHDTLARIGGDEFAILVRGGSAAAERLIARLRRALAQPFAFGEAEVRVGASFGIAERLKEDRQIGDLVDRADDALYAAKSARSRLTA